MNIKVWSNFSKRINSTKQPTGGTQISNVNLKESTSIEEPTLMIASNDLTINYVEVFGHYYFGKIKSVRNGLIELDCKIDTLATYKSQITGSSAYIERAAGGQQLKRYDELIPPTDEIENTETLIMSLTDRIVDINGSTGLINDHYIMGVVGQDGVCYWGLTGTQLVNFFNTVFDLNFIQQFQTIFYDYRDCVISLKKVTYEPNGDPGQEIYLGEHNTHCTGTALSNTPLHQDSNLVTLSFPSDFHEQLSVLPLDKDPYTTGTLFLPGVGVIPLDLDILCSTRKLGVKLSLDCTTATVVYRLYTTGSRILASYQGSLGSDVPIASQNYNPQGMVSGAIQVIGGVAGAFAGGPVAGMGAASILGGAGTIASSAKIHTQVNGGLSSLIGGYIGQGLHAEIYTRVPATWDIAEHRALLGVPICRTMALSSLSGYVKCAGASINIPGTDAEKTEVNSYLNSGFYIE